MANPINTEPFALNGVTKHALGMFKRANAFYNRALGLDPNHYSWYQVCLCSGIHFQIIASTHALVAAQLG